MGELFRRVSAESLWESFGDGSEMIRTWLGAVKGRTLVVSYGQVDESFSCGGRSLAASQRWLLHDSAQLVLPEDHDAVDGMRQVRVLF